MRIPTISPISALLAASSLLVLGCGEVADSGQGTGLGGPEAQTDGGTAPDAGASSQSSGTGASSGAASSGAASSGAGSSGASSSSSGSSGSATGQGNFADASTGAGGGPSGGDEGKGSAADAGGAASEPPYGDDKSSSSSSSSSSSGADAGSPFEQDAGSTVSIDAGSTDGADAKPAPKTCNKTDETTLYLSADDSNSMAGATIARGLIKQGQHVYKGLRTYEFLNYYAFDYPAAKIDHVAVSAQLRKGEGGRFTLQVGVRAPDVQVAQRRRVHAVLAVDTSASMGWGPKGETGIDRARAACLAIAGSLLKGDRISLVTWGGATQTILPYFAVGGPNDTTLVGACTGLSVDGVTNLGGGLSKAYDLAEKHFDKARINRVILVSDGGTNVGDKDAELIAEHAKDANGEAIYLVGVGVGDPWNYNDKLMNTVTDAGKGAYVFLDSTGEAAAAFGAGFVRHIEVAARDVQVAVTLPPTFRVQTFYGEQISTNASEVEPQHLAMNDAMIFNQVITSCDPSSLTGAEKLKVVATWEHPITRKKHTDSFEATWGDLLAGDKKLLDKGDAVVAFAEALKDLRKLSGAKALLRIDLALGAIQSALSELGGDADLKELRDLLTLHKEVYAKGQKDLYPTGGTGAKPIGGACKCKDTGQTIEAMACAMDLCDQGVLLGQSYASTTDAATTGTFAAVARLGSKSNDLAPRIGASYAVMGTGPVAGTAHSKAMGGKVGIDPVAGGGMYDAMEYTLKLKAPAGANGFRIRHVFFSEEYDEYVGSKYNDKFYMILRAGSTNGGRPTVINYTACREPDKHHDFVCSPGMQFCNPRQRYCYIAINTAASECCWLNGCPDGKAKTDISGTGFSCAPSKGGDSASRGSSTGWLVTEWPIEPGEEFELTFHVHDTGDGVYDSAVILDGLQFVGSVTPGTWQQTL